MFYLSLATQIKSAFDSMDYKFEYIESIED